MQFVERHVMDVALTAPIDDLGFLRVLDDFGLAVLQSDRPVELGSLTGAGSFVLLAHGAAGKTWSLRHLTSSEPNSVTVDLRLKTMSEARVELSRAKEVSSIVYVDHLDEVLQGLPSLPRLLQTIVAGSDAADTRWRFGCRHAAWADGIGQAIGSVVTQYRLLPLTLDAAVDLTAGIVDEDALVDALTRHRLRFLPSTPSRLVAMARRVAEGDDTDLSMVQLLRAETDRLLSEWDEVRPQPNSPLSRRRAVAGRLAAFTVLSGIRGFALRGDDDSGRGLPLQQLPDDPEPTAPQERVLPDEYREALSTSLFESAGPDLVRFAHEQLAESLAADYVRLRAITASQAQQVLRVSKHGVLPGRLAGMAAWLGADSPDLVRHVVEKNPLVFARAGVELAGADLRRAVVNAIVSSATRGDLQWTWGLDLSALDYPALSDDLCAAANSPWQGFYLPWWISHIAAACGVREIVPTLLAWAANDELAQASRAAAISAAGVLGTAGEKAELLPLLDEDIDDELFGRCLQALHPDVLSSADLVSRLRPVTSRVIGGAYANLLDELGSRLSPTNLCAFLEMLSSWEMGQDTGHRGVMRSALDAAWNVAGESQEVLEAMASLIATVHDRDATLHEDHDRPHPWRRADVHQRRRLAMEVAKRSDSSWYVLLTEGLVTNQDLEWIVFGLGDLDHSPARERLLGCARQIGGTVDATLADAVLRLPDDHYAYEATDSFRGTCSLETDHYRRRVEMRDRERDAQLQRQQARERFGSDLRDALEAAADDLSEWWRVVLLLGDVRDDDRTQRLSDPAFSYDLTRRPGWSQLPQSAREEIVDLGLAYLSHREPDPNRWRARTGYSREEIQEAYADWAAVYLLTTITRHGHDQLRELDDETLVRWWPVIFAAWNHDRDDDRFLVIDLVNEIRSREHGAVSLRGELLLEIEARRSSPANQSLPEWWSAALPLVTDALHDLLLDLDDATPVDHRLFELFAVADPDAVRSLAEAIMGEPGHPLRLQAFQYRAGDPTVVTQLLEEPLDLDELAAVCKGLDLGELAPSIRGRLLLAVVDRQALAEDKPLSEGWSPGSPRRTLTDTRNAIADSLAQEGRVEVLQGFDRTRPESERWYWRRYVMQARQAATDLDDERPEPAALLQLLSTTDARLVRSDDDLLELVVACLDQVQLDLRNGTWKMLWDLGERPRPKSEDDVTDEIVRLLRGIVSGRVATDREVQVARPNPVGIGQRVDLVVGAGAAQHRVMIEAKHVHSREVLTSMPDQLCDRYLEQTGNTHGIYLVYWTPPEARRTRGPSDSATRLECQEELNALAAQLGDEFTVRPYVLDISQPNGT